MICFCFVVYRISEQDPHLKNTEPVVVFGKRRAQLGCPPFLLQMVLDTTLETKFYINA